MKLPMVRLIFAAALLFLMAFGATSQAQAAPVRNIVLVHGAFVSGAGWKPVYEILEKPADISVDPGSDPRASLSS